MCKKTFKIALMTMLMSLSASFIALAEPQLDELPLDNWYLYSTTTIDLHNAIKDPGNEYEITWYCGDEMVNQVYGLYGNQMIPYQFIRCDCVGKEVYAVITSINGMETATTEKVILAPARGNAEIIQEVKDGENTLKIQISNFDDTNSYTYKWYCDGDLISENYEINCDSLIGKEVYCEVQSCDTGHKVTSNKLIVSQRDTLVENISLNGDWITNKDKIQYIYNNGSYHKGYREGLNIYYDWDIIDDKWYSFDDSGYLDTGFITDATDKNTYYVDKNLGVLSGWHKIEDKWYYFKNVHDGEFGKLLRNTITPDGFAVDENGVWIEY